MGIAGRMFDEASCCVLKHDAKRFPFSCGGHKMSSAVIFEGDDKVAMLRIWVMLITGRQLQSR